MLNMINQCASVCILNKKDVPSHNQNESETLMEGKKKINNNGFDYVDLGLPSGTLWATCNVGASKPSEYGLLFQWGDTQGWATEQVGFGEGKKKFLYDDYKWAIKESVLTFSKYTTPGASLELEDDAAHVNMGGDWHMPTPEQFKELINETTSKWERQNGVNGMKFISKEDESKYIFIPAAGDAWHGSINNNGREGNLWSSMMDDAWGTYNGQGIEFYCYSKDSEHVFSHGGDRCCGFSIRGVIGQILKGENNDKRRIRAKVKHKF